MKVQIRDKDALESLTTANLRAYLETHGWVDVRHWGERVTIHSKEQCGKLWEIAIPNREDCSDYAEFMAEAVTTLADAEDRSQLDVFYDLASAEADILAQANYERAGTIANVWCVRAEFGKYTNHFVSGGYAGAGWIRGADLTEITDRAELRHLYKEAYPQNTKPHVSANVGQIYRFIVEMNPGDYIITPTTDSALLRYGSVLSGPYYKPDPNDGCPFPHRRKVDWAKHPLNKKNFSKEFRNTMQSAMTIFSIRHREEFLGSVVKALWPNARW